VTLQVEWDEPKRQSNLKRHGVDFEVASLIFRGDVLEAEDDRSAYGERRLIALGKVRDATYVVVYTWRGAARRIISAWKVGEDGEKRYQAVLTRRTSGEA
jgi:uncharacterized protein